MWWSEWSGYVAGVVLLMHCWNALWHQPCVLLLALRHGTAAHVYCWR